MTEKQSKILKLKTRKIINLIKQNGLTTEIRAEAERILQQVEIPVRSGNRFKLIKPFSHLALDEILNLSDDDVDFLLSDSEMED